jgi:hypothetical protein
MMTRTITCLLAVLVLSVAIAVRAAEPAPAPAPAPDLTPFGAIRAGNAEGTIPEWTGGMTTLPANAEPGEHLPDPYPDDVRWFSVTAANLQRYAPRVAPGHRALLRAWPDRYELRVFLTRRTAAAPQAIYDETIANGTRARLTDNGLAVSGARIGIPFPTPRSGAEAMWNHILRWRGTSVSRFDGYMISDENANPEIRLFHEAYLSGYALGYAGPVALYYRRAGLGPVDMPGGGTLVIHETGNALTLPRAAWYRPAGEPIRVLNASDYSYDTPDPATDGVRTADMLDMFSGLLDRFDWKLVGRREMIVPYNAFRINTGQIAPQDFLLAHFPDPSFLRYEVHRVWVVEARLKPNIRHAFVRRTYYLDEDSWQILVAEHYDAKGTLARFAEAHGVPFPHVPVFAPTLQLVYDLTTGRVLVTGIDNQEPPPAWNVGFKPQGFSPEALREPPPER